MKKKVKKMRSAYDQLWKAHRLEGVVKNRGIRKKKKRKRTKTA